MEIEEERYNFLQKRSGLSKLEFARSLGYQKSGGTPSQKVFTMLPAKFWTNCPLYIAST
ncbi:MAG: hypothetical protein LBV68_01535 [Spirochaetaceae bacterium]|jgi:hypothetical protein|nr:hypothetical protein [Spirochaetaceae bacterium]